MKFSAGHFTVFSEIERERIHGHNFSVECTIEADITNNGMLFSYAKYKKIFVNLCKSLDEFMLLPANSKYLNFSCHGESIHCIFGDDLMVFPCKDVKILPVENITIETLASWFLSSFLELLLTSDKDNFYSIEIAVSSSKSQSGLVTWKKNF